MDKLLFAEITMYALYNNTKYTASKIIFIVDEGLIANVKYLNCLRNNYPLANKFLR